MVNDPKLAVWVTANDRDYVKQCLPAFVKQCTYPNYELLISHHRRAEAPDIWAFLNDFPFERKRVFDTSDLDLASAYYLLLEHSPDWYLNIEDDFLFLHDPAAMIRDAIALMGERQKLCTVRVTSHTPLFIDVLHPRHVLQATPAGPAVLNFGMGNTQNVTRSAACRSVPDVWQRGVGFRKINMCRPLREAGYFGCALLRHWGCSVHIGDMGVDGQVTEENRLNHREAMVLRKYHMFGPRLPGQLYSGSLNEEQKREFVYPLYLRDVRSLVPNHVPVEAQERIGPCTATQIC